jgi:hypothetical protein
MKWFLRSSLLLLLLSIINAANCLAEEKGCTLESDKGSKQVRLTNNVVASMTWEACTTLVTNIIFTPINPAMTNDPNATLKRAAALIAELETKTGKPICPFDGNIATALNARLQKKNAYEFGDNIPVSNTDVPGWDGVSVSVNQTKGTADLEVRYWANP